MQFVGVKIQRYRSIMDLKIDISSTNLDIICGSNNVGKTNVLRALDLYFSLDTNKFDPDSDIPYHIRYGARGGSDYTKITGFFKDKQLNQNYRVEVSFKERQKQKIIEIKGYRGNQIIQKKDAEAIIKKFRFIFIESSNVDLPSIIREIFKEKALTTLDSQRKAPKEALKKIKEFHELSEKAVNGIEKEITSNFQIFLEDQKINQDEIKNWKLQVKFPPVETLREAIADQINFTLNDSNDNPIESKGSGIQKIILISLITYVSDILKKYEIIWGIDEPEAFLQPLLQKKLFRELKSLSKKYNIMITTHSNFFIDLDNIDQIIMLTSNVKDKPYKRRPNKAFCETSTNIVDKKGYEKLQLIKEHMGLDRNDSWEVYPENILVEGDTDKKYLETLIKAFNYNSVKIISAGGADNIRPLLSLWNDIANDIKDFKPKVFCILDYDEKGKEIYNKINSKNFKNINIEKDFIPRYDGVKETTYEYTVEDFIYPELILNEVNKWLKSVKEYKEIPYSKFTQRNDIAYDKISILKFLSEKCNDLNSDKERINLSSNDGLKKIMCQKIIQRIIKTQIHDGLHEKYPEVKLFIKKISEYFEEN